MSQYPADGGPQDRTTIDTREPWDVAWWCRKWNVSPPQLKAAVKAVGPLTTDVARHLGKKILSEGLRKPL